MKAWIRIGLVCVACCVMTLWGASANAAPTVLTSDVIHSDMINSDIINNDGSVIGSLRLQQGTAGVLVNISAADLPAGSHGTHFHTVGDCSDLEGFTTAGGHVNPFSKPHGFLNPDGPHEGNLPNLVVTDNGTVDVELYSELVSLADGTANLLDADGSALIIHVNQDDHFSQPIGGSGARIACAVIKQ